MSDALPATECDLWLYIYIYIYTRTLYNQKGLKVTYPVPGGWLGVALGLRV